MPKWKLTSMKESDEAGRAQNIERKTMFHPELQPSRIARRLTIIRKANGLGLMEMADAIKVHRPSWTRFETGQRAIPIAKAQVMVELFGVTLDYIYLGRTDTLSGVTREALRSAEKSLNSDTDEA